MNWNENRYSYIYVYIYMNVKMYTRCLIWKKNFKLCCFRLWFIFRRRWSFRVLFSLERAEIVFWKYGNRPFPGSLNIQKNQKYFFTHVWYITHNGILKMMQICDHFSESPHQYKFERKKEAIFKRSRTQVCSSDGPQAAPSPKLTKITDFKKRAQKIKPQLTVQWSANHKSRITPCWKMCPFKSLWNPLSILK